MTIYYTADRSGQIRTGQKFDLYSKPQNFQNARVIQGVYDHTDLSNYLQTYYPSGISLHGMRYLLENENYIYAAAGEFVNGVTSLSPAIEITFELIRRHNFPEAPSRFTCAFACESPQNCLDFFNIQSLPVFEITTTNKTFRGDMSFLKLGANHAATEVLANMYWSGKIMNNSQVEILVEAPATIGNKVLN